MLAGATVLLVLASSASGAGPDASRAAQIGEARRGGVSVRIAPAVSDVVVSSARAAGRPIVVIDAGHGGHDPGAAAVSGSIVEKQLTLMLARELRDRLVDRGRVRVALTRDSDRYLTLEERAGVARRLGASLFLSLHMDSAQITRRGERVSIRCPTSRRMPRPLVWPNPRTRAGSLAKRMVRSAGCCRTWLCAAR